MGSSVSSSQASKKPDIKYRIIAQGGRAVDAILKFTNAIAMTEDKQLIMFAADTANDAIRDLEALIEKLQRKK